MLNFGQVYDAMRYATLALAVADVWSYFTRL
jgi:hypothetical protein